MTWIAARHHSIGHQQEIIDTRCGNASRRLEQGAGVGPRGGRDRLTVGEGMIKCHILAWCRVLIVEAAGLKVERESQLLCEKRTECLANDGFNHASKQRVNPVRVRKE